jgi:hypothetical protein
VRAELTAAVDGLALGHDHDDRGSALADEAAPEGAGYLVPGLDGSADHDQVSANLLGDPEQFPGRIAAGVDEANIEAVVAVPVHLGSQ